MARPRLLGLALAPLLSGCPRLVDYEVGAGVGAACVEDRDCQGASCVDEVCTRFCAQPADCPEGSRCSGDRCQVLTDAR